MRVERKKAEKMHTIISFKYAFLALALFAHGRAQEPPVEIPTLEIAIPRCGDCHCIPEEGEDCPGTRDKSFEVVGDQFEYINQRALNPYTLSCNPFVDVQCETTPPQEFLSLGNEAVCGIHYLVPASSRLCPRQYKLQSYPSQLEAEADGAIVTHVGCKLNMDDYLFLGKKNPILLCIAFVPINMLIIIIFYFTKHVVFVPVQVTLPHLCQLKI